jgi:hypothetical protein
MKIASATISLLQVGFGEMFFGFVENNHCPWIKNGKN